MILISVGSYPEHNYRNVYAEKKDTTLTILGAILKNKKVFALRINCQNQSSDSDDRTV